MLTDPQRSRLQLLLDIKANPNLASILLIEELKNLSKKLDETIALLKEISQKESPAFPEIPALPEIPKTDLTEIVQLLTQLVQKEKEPIDIKLKIL